jgi:predicted P-loop ATPase
MHHYTNNLWIPFAMQLLKGVKYEPSEIGREFILNHFKIMCNHDMVLYNYFIKWVAQMFQYPETKTVAFVFLGTQGSGKSTVTEILKKMMGSKRVLDTKRPTRDVTGEFNELMADAFLVNISEAKLKDSKDGSGEIKGLITDEFLPINKKGMGKLTIRSYHRFIFDSNNLNCIETSSDDRRFVIARVSDEKVGDSKYFETLRGYINDINVLRTLFDYLMAIPDMQTFLN